MTQPSTTQGACQRCLTATRKGYGAARRFLNDDVWDLDVASFSGLRRLVFSVCRIGAIVVRGFIADNCYLQASALTYITLMSMVPVLALMFSFTKGIGMQNRLIEAVGLERVEIQEPAEDGTTTTRVEFHVARLDPTDDVAPPSNGQFSLEGLPEPMQKAVTTILSYVENTNFGAMGLVGSLLLFWGIIKAMTKLEFSFNTIWGTKTARPLFRRLTEYFFVLALIPVLFLVVTSVNAGLSSPAAVGRLRDWVGPLAGFYLASLRLFGIVVVMVTFAFLFKFMPNTDVKTLPALAGGVVAGILWYVTQWAYITFQIGVTEYNAIYGTFAAVPFFLAWLYTNWILVLFGAEVSFAVQNYRTYVHETSPAATSPAARVSLGIVLTYETCKAYLAGERGWRPAAFAREHAIPARLVASVANTLVTSGILVPVDVGADRDRCYVPGQAPDRLTLADVETAVRANDRAYTGRLLHLVPDGVATAMASHYDDFIGHLSSISFQDLITNTAAKTAATAATAADAA